MIRPLYPIYVPSKGRSDVCLTARMLDADHVPYQLVVEDQEADLYAREFGAERLLILPFRDQGSVIPARNWIKDHAAALGYERHWQLDDNIAWLERWYQGRRIRCDAGVALAVCEDFTDRFENVAISGLNYHKFAISPHGAPPFVRNVHVYSCSLILNALPNRWRGTYNEDTDYCLQVLTDGWCTLLVNAFLAEKITTMRMHGGNTDALYQGDGRLKMARELEHRWPGIVTVRHRFHRAQHVINWRRFVTPLKLRRDAPTESRDYGLDLVQVSEIKSASLKAWVAGVTAK